MPTAGVMAGTSLVGNLVGGGKASSAQQNATNQAAAQQQQVMQMVQNYIGSVSPAVSQLVGGLLSGSNPISQAINSAVSGLAGFGGSTENQALENYSGLKPQELGALTTNAAASGQSDIATAESQGAFGANQNAGIENALQKNQLASESAAVNVGAAAAQQEESAQASAAQNALGGLESSGQIGTNQLSATDSGITSAENLLNPTASGATQLSGLATGNQQTAAGYGNPYGPAATSAGQVLATMPGSGGKGSSSPQSTLGNLNYYGNNATQTQGPQLNATTASNLSGMPI